MQHYIKLKGDVKVKKIISILLILSLAMTVFIGCSTTKKEEKDNQEPATNNTQKTDDSKEKEDTVTDEKVTVEFWHGYSADKAEVLDEFIADYEAENPNVTVNAKFVAAGGEMLQKVQAAIISDSLPDMLWGYPTWTGVLESSGKLVEVGTLMDEDYTKDIPEGLLNAGRYNEKIYSVPIEAGTLYMIYNLDMFEEAGIKQAPTTWEELYDVAKKLTNDDHKGIWLPIAPNERTTWTWECFLWQNGQDLLTPDYKTITFDNEKGLEALETYTKFIADGIAPLTVGQDPFIDKDVAIIYGTQGAANAYINKYNMNVGVAMLPGKEKLATGLGSNHYFLFNNDTKKQEEAFKFIKWMTTGDTNANWAMKSGYLPVSISGRESEKYQEFGIENPHYIEAAKALAHGVARPPIEEYPKLSELISSTIEKIAYGSLTSKQGMDEIVKGAKSIFSN